MAQKTIEKLVNLIEDEIKANGSANITAAKLQNVLIEVAQNSTEEKIPCDPGLSEASIGLALGLDTSDNLVKLYEEEEAVTGQFVIYEIEVNTLTAEPVGETIKKITLEDGSNNSIVDVLATDWNDYASAPTDTIEEAQNIANHIENNVPNWSANWIEGENKVQIISDNLPSLFLNHSIEKLNVDFTIATIQEALPEIPKYSKRLFVGFLGGVDTINEVKYAVIRTGKIQKAVVISRNEIDITEINALTNPNESSALLVACDGGKVRSFSSELDYYGIVGFALNSVPDSGEEQQVLIREVFTLNNK